MFSFTFPSPFKVQAQAPRKGDIKLLEVEEGTAKVIDINQSGDLDMPAAADTPTPQDFVGLPLYHSGNGRWGAMDDVSRQQEDSMDEDSQLRTLEEGGTKETDDPNTPASFDTSTPQGSSTLFPYPPGSVRQGVVDDNQQPIQKLHHAPGSLSVVKKLPMEISRERKDKRDHSAATKVWMVESASRLPALVNIFYAFGCWQL